MARPRTYRTQLLDRIILTSLALVLLLLTGPRPSARAQARAPRRIILPPKAFAGMPATLAVLDAAGRLLPGVEVELPGGQRVKTDVTGRAYFTAPGVPGVLTAEIADAQITASATIVSSAATAPPGSAGSPSQNLQILSSPRFFSVRDQLTVEGTGFRGEAGENHVSLADQPCLVLAASPVSLVVLPGPRTPVGAVGLRVSVGGQQAGPELISAVSLEVTGPPEALRVGARTKLTVWVRGSTERLVLEVHNASPEIIQLSRGNLQRVTTSGGNRNVAEVELKCLASGDYLVTARLIPTASGLPDLGAARRKLVAARAVATGTWAARVDRVIRRIDRDPQDTRQIRAELERLLNDKPSGELAFLLESAWEEFHKYD
jgi:IPT/TIG domain